VGTLKGIARCPVNFFCLFMTVFNQFFPPLKGKLACEKNIKDFRIAEKTIFKVKRFCKPFLRKNDLQNRFTETLP